MPPMISPFKKATEGEGGITKRATTVDIRMEVLYLN